MTKTEIQREALALPIQDRLELADVLWASIDHRALPSDAPLPQWQKDLLDERLEETKDDPGEPWDKVKAELWPDAP